MVPLPTHQQPLSICLCFVVHTNGPHQSTHGPCWSTCVSCWPAHGLCQLALGSACLKHPHAMSHMLPGTPASSHLTIRKVLGLWWQLELLGLSLLSDAVMWHHALWLHCLVMEIPKQGLLIMWKSWRWLHAKSGDFSWKNQENSRFQISGLW